MTGITPATPAHRLGPPAGVILIAVLAMLAAACAGSPSSAGPGGASSSRSAVGYSACMRSHGVLSFPDPDSGGHLPKADPHQLGVSPSQLQAAQRACQHVLPNTGASFQQQTQQCFLADACPPALVQRILTAQRRYARCIRSHGVPNWPDPTIDSQGRPYFDVSKAGVSSQSTHSSAFASKDPRMRAPCQRLLRRRTRGDGVRGAGMRGVIATAALTVLAAACSSSPSSAGAGSPPGGPGSSPSTSGVAYSACMRSHGVPSFPDPDSQRKPPEGRRAASRGERLPARGGPASVSAPVAEHRRGDRRRLGRAVHDGRRLSPSLCADGAG